MTQIACLHCTDYVIFLYIILQKELPDFLLITITNISVEETDPEHAYCAFQQATKISLDIPQKGQTLVGIMPPAVQEYCDTHTYFTEDTEICVD